MGWLSALLKRFKLGHAQGMDYVGMAAMERCARRFPQVFSSPPWVEFPRSALERLHNDAEYSLARVGLHSAFENSDTAGDERNAAIAILEMAKLTTRARDWENAESATDQAVRFCKLVHSRDRGDPQLTELYVDAMLWRGLYVAFGDRSGDRGILLLEGARAEYEANGITEGVKVVNEMLPHVQSS